MYRLKYQNKYKAKKQEFNGIQYHSKKEAAYAHELSIRKAAGEIKDWERQTKISLDVNGKHIANYYIDFVVYHNCETLEYVEVKGFETPEWRLKWKLFHALYGHLPNVLLTVVK